MSTKDGQEKIREMILQRILDNVQKENLLPWQRPWQKILPINYKENEPYRGINKLLMEGGEFMTMKQGNSLGFSLKKGSGGDKILGIKYGTSWKAVTASEFEELVIRYCKYFSMSDREAVIRKAMSAGFIRLDPKDKSKYQRSISYMSYFYVYPIQCFEDKDGIEPKSRYETGDLNLELEEPEKLSDKYLSREKIPLTFKGNSAFYAHSINGESEYIQLPPKNLFKSEEGYYGTLFHEIAHSTGHRRRLNRNMGGMGQAYSFEELVAEITSSYVSAQVGVDLNKNIENSSAYIKSWLEVLKSDKAMILKAAAKAEQAKDFIYKTECA